MSPSSQNLRLMNFHGFETLVSESLGVSPFFSSMISYRVHHKLCTNIAVTGEPGIGKSYEAIEIARVNEGLKKNGKDRFTVKQIVFRHSEYMDLLINLRMGKAIVFDEPSYSLGKRDWFKELQKVLVHTLESQRFLVHPLFIPIINTALLDKTIRSYLIQYKVHVVGRGHGKVYRIYPSQQSEKIYHYHLGDLYYRMFDSEECKRDSCLGCKSMDKCQVFRAQYERKKKEIQHERYEQAKEQASQKESQDLTEEQLEQMILPHIPEMISDNGKLNVSKIRVFLRESGVHISSWKGYQVKSNIENAHPELFEQ